MDGSPDGVGQLLEGNLLKHANPPLAKKGEQGAALLLLVLMLLFVVLPMTGLAISSGMAYLARTRLSSAVDAAALAGARSLSIGSDLQSQTATADATVRAYLNANFPDGLYGTSNLTISSSIQQTAYKTRTVSVRATVAFPTLTLGLLSNTSSSIAAFGQASRRDVNIMLVLDRSGSMQGTPCQMMKADAQAFADRFTNGRDRLGLITFKASAHVDMAPTLYFKTATPSVDTTIGQVQCSGNTGSAQALWYAYQQIKAINEPGALNIIVYFTDGQPNGVAAQFPVKTLTDNRYDSKQTGNSVGNMPPSSCSASAVSGILAQSAPDGATTGYTLGVMDPAGTDITSTADPLADAPGCKFSSKGSLYAREDIAFIPDTDLWGNSILGYKPLDVFPPGHAYAGRTRVDSPLTVVYASTNAADDAARRIRNDRAFSPIIYSIGLGGDGWVDHDFLKRVANDPQASSFDATKPAGLYVYAPNAGQLGSAFNRIASEILRLAK